MPRASSPPPSVSEQIAKALEIVLRIPRANRTVADFLFTDLTENPFHPSYVLPPTAWHNSVTLHSDSSLNTCTNALYPPAATHMSFSEQMLPTETSECLLKSFFHLTLLPIAHLPPYTLGYAFNYTPPDSTIRFDANPFSAPRLSRFVFDPYTSEVVLSTYGGTPASIGLHSILTSTTSVREHRIMVIPPMQYQWPHLPSIGMWMVSCVEYRIPSHSSVSEPPSAEIISIDTTLPEDPFPSHRMELPSAAPSYQPWLLSHTGQLSDGTNPIPPASFVDPQSFSPSLPVLSAETIGGTAGSAFASDQLSAILPVLSASFSGNFYTPSMRMDIPNPKEPSTFISTFTGRATSCFTPAEETVVFQMRQRFAMAHYLTVLSVSIDNCFDTSAPSNVTAPSQTKAPSRAPEDSIQVPPISDGWQSTIHALINVEESADPNTGYDLDDTINLFLNDEIADSFIPFNSNSFDVSTRSNHCTPNSSVLSAESEEACKSQTAEPDTGNKNHGLLQKTQDLTQRQAVPIAPRPVTVPPFNSDEKTGTTREASWGSDNPKITTLEHNCNALTQGRETVQDEERESMLALRRKRNRLSAARSNERKKRWIAALERDVEQSQRRVVELMEIQARVQEENRALHAQLVDNLLGV